MKELSIEEKAKRYDEAIERAKVKLTNEIAENIFPELKENEDEKIRENCIHFLELQKQHHAATFEIEECIDWLEKQGEHKPADKVEPKFKVGDKVYALSNRFECTIESVDETTYYGDTTNFDIKDQDNWELVEQRNL